MRKYLRFITGLHRYLKERFEPMEALDQAMTQLRKRIACRETNFLNLVRKGIYGYPRSPYLRLLASRRIAFSDVKKWVKSDGIEEALMRLREEGVYFTVDEFKGKSELNRNGVRFKCVESMFDNPFFSHAYEVRSGATRSAGTRVRIDFEYLKQRAHYDALLLHTHGVLDAPIANWFPVFPGAPGINSSLRFLRIGNPPQRWFSQVSVDDIKVNWEKAWGAQLILLMAKWHGAPLAAPEYADLNNAGKVAEWAARTLEDFPRCAVYTFASSAVRVCAAARDLGLNLKGARFLVTGEPLTPQKKLEIEAVGAVAIPVYGISEAGVIAAGCGRQHHPDIVDHCHLYKDSTALITHHYEAPLVEAEVNAFLFTTLLYESPKLLLNVGMGDYGVVTDCSDDCPYTKLGYDACLGQIRSYEKLTGEGVTFVDTDFIRVIEKELPSRFGGLSTDYQLIEDEDEVGVDRLLLLVSPRLGSLDEQAVAREFIELLRRAEDSPESWAQAGSVMWKQAGTVHVQRRFPVPTLSGKILPFHLLGPNAKSALAKITCS